MYIVGMKDNLDALERIKKYLDEATQLDATKTTHHIDQFLLSKPEQSPFFKEKSGNQLSELDKARDLAAYTAAVAAARAKATKRSNHQVAADYVMSKTRESHEVPDLSPWKRAQIDVFHEVVRVAMAERGANEDDPRVHPIANVFCLQRWIGS